MLLCDTGRGWNEEVIDGLFLEVDKVCIYKIPLGSSPSSVDNIFMGTQFAKED